LLVFKGAAHTPALEFFPLNLPPSLIKTIWRRFQKPKANCLFHTRQWSWKYQHQKKLP
jgi:hypothetical protein